MSNPEDDEIRLRLIENDKNDENISPPQSQQPQPSAPPIEEPSASSSSEIELNCPVCLDSIQDGDDVKTTLCNHVFHRRCVDQWLATHNTCPQCRTELFDVSDLPIPPGREPEGYLCVCRQTYCCYSSQATRGCLYVIHFILVVWSGWMIISLFTNNSDPRDIYFTLSIIVDVALFVFNVIMFIMLRFNIQFNNWRLSRVQPPILPM